MTAGHDTSTPHRPKPARGVAEQVRAVVGGLRAERGPLLPVLHAVQAEFGFVPAEAVPVIAEELNLSRADVHGVVTFYRDFRTEPPGRTVVRICRAEACQAVGAEALVAGAVDRLGTPLGSTTADGALTLDEVFCLGNCALGPSVQVGDAVYGRVDVERLVALAGPDTRNGTTAGRAS